MNERYVTGAALRERLEALAPPHLAESWDNVGWQVGHDGAQIRGLLVTLDVELAVVEEASRLGANAIVAHHPFLFRGLKRIDPSAYEGRLLRRLLCEEMVLFAAHTNLDAVRGGVNDALAGALGLEPVAPLQPIAGSAWGFGAICEGPPLPTAALLRRCREALAVAQPRVTAGRPAPATHSRIALLGGSGASMIPDALRVGCTLFITGEVKYHEAQEAARAGLTLIEVGHFESERPVLAALAAWLAPLGVPIHQSQQITSPFVAEWEDV